MSSAFPPPDGEDRPLRGSEYETWHLHDAGGPMLRLKVRFRNEREVPDWRGGPDFAEALEAAMADGWRLFDREPGEASGEYAILHLRREARPNRPSR